MLNKDFYREKLNEIENALDESDEWYNADEYKENFWIGLTIGIFTPILIILGTIILYKFIHFAAQP